MCARGLVASGRRCRATCGRKHSGMTFSNSGIGTTLERIHHALYVAVRSRRDGSKPTAGSSSPDCKGAQKGVFSRPFGLRRALKVSMVETGILATSWFRLAVGLVVGLALSGFATMPSYRLPRRLSIVFPRSHCPPCKAVLKIRDFVPVFPWLFVRGKYHHDTILREPQHRLDDVNNTRTSSSAKPA